MDVTVKTDKVNYEDCHNIKRVALKDMIFGGNDVLELEFNTGRIDILNTSNNTKGYAIVHQWTFEEMQDIILKQYKEANIKVNKEELDKAVKFYLQGMNGWLSTDKMYSDATHIANIIRRKGYKDVTLHYSYTTRAEAMEVDSND